MVRGRVIRRLVHVLFGWWLTTLSWLGPGRPGCSTWPRTAPKPRSKRGWHSVPKAWCDGVEVVAMDGFTGSKTAASEEVPTATAVMEPLHVVRLARDALDQCRRRVQQELHGHRGQAGDPLFPARCTLHAGTDLLTEQQRGHLAHLPEDDRRLPRVRLHNGQNPDEVPDRQTHPCCPGLPDRGRYPRMNPEETDRRRPRVLRPPLHQQRPHRNDQRPPRTPPRLRARFSHPDYYITRAHLETDSFKPALHPQL